MPIWNEMRQELAAQLRARRDRVEGKYFLLRQLMQRFMERFRHFSDNNMKLAEYHFVRGNFTDARIRYRLVLWQQPGNAAAWAGYGESLLREGERDQARAALQKALKLAPDNERVRAALASLSPPKKQP